MSHSWLPTPDSKVSKGGKDGLVNLVLCTVCITHLDEQVVLNEVVIDRGVSPFLCNLECFCDGNFVTHVQGDGLIVSTPTGSTAYNLAAGGSMVHPQVRIPSLCRHALNNRATCRINRYRSRRVPGATPGEVPGL